ncbi:MAG TPA: GNAT family N-acetyltransferase [Catenuloplanes sp.]
MTVSLYLNELYVWRSHRRCGVGAQLIAHICSIAAEAGCSRVEWATDRDNTDARAFYEQLAAPANAEKIMYRLDQANLILLAHRHRAADPLAGPSTLRPPHQHIP